MAENGGNGDGWFMKAAVGAMLALLASLMIRGCEFRDDVLNRLTSLEYDWNAEKKRSIEQDNELRNEINRLTDLFVERMGTIWRLLSETDRPPPERENDIQRDDDRRR